MTPEQTVKESVDVAYEAGELRTLSFEMVGWEIALEGVDTKRFERGVVKQIDCDINCALVLFTGGKKLWLNLTFFRVKIPGHQVSLIDDNTNSECARVIGVTHSSPSNKLSQSQAWDSSQRPNAAVKTNEILETIEHSAQPYVSVAASPLRIPRVNPNDFDWNLGGTHVELCNRGGQFLEVAHSVQSFRVVIHGLESVKTFPVGQIVDVYSPLIGRFRSGTALKIAALGHLTPIRFRPGKAVEWVDLK
ncbi:unnamed protein product [Phytophthora fragariaefolia]|uniref:Unnamed protein product n=1 Tax=Phytophthora fragariaefolia TaxID=1490495 RepID=A0A9W6U573_9STRA|nr:unnamed protein product [Phytophthora fragariaefolia]